MFNIYLSPSHTQLPHPHNLRLGTLPTTDFSHQLGSFAHRKWIPISSSRSLWRDKKVIPRTMSNFSTRLENERGTYAPMDYTWERERDPGLFTLPAKRE